MHRLFTVRAGSATKFRAPSALTISGRGFGSRVSPGSEPTVHGLSESRGSCGACVQACPTAALTETAVIEIGQPEHSAITTCAYCGVGCSFKAEMRGEELVRMVPWKDGKANRTATVASGPGSPGATPPTASGSSTPMIRKSIDDPWTEVSWDEAIAYTASEFKRIQARHGTRSVSHLVIALHQRRGVAGAAGPPGLRQQQRRHLCAGLSLAHRLWPQPDLRHLSGHPGL